MLRASAAPALHLSRFVVCLAAASFGCSSGADEERCDTIAGDAPFAVGLGGVVTYFPEGRHPGAPVMFFSNGEQTVDRTLGPDGGATFSFTDHACGGTVDGRLEGPAGGISAIVTTTGSVPWSDVRDSARATRSEERWCQARAISETTTKVDLYGVTPVEAIVVATNHPLAVDSEHPPPVTLDDAPVAVAAEPLSLGLSISGAHGAFPRGSVVWIDTSAVRDVVGRAIGPAVEARVMNVKADVTDLGFASPPPEGAVAASTAVEPTGETLRFRAGSDAALRIVLGVGGPAGATAVRVRHRLVCEGRLVRRAEAYLVGADGSKAAISVECGEAPAEVRSTLPGPAPWSIVIVGPPNQSMPCNYPDFSKSPGYEIDAVAFEP